MREKFTVQQSLLPMLLSLGRVPRCCHCCPLSRLPLLPLLPPAGMCATLCLTHPPLFGPNFALFIQGSHPSPSRFTLFALNVHTLRPQGSHSSPSVALLAAALALFAAALALFARESHAGHAPYVRYASAPLERARQTHTSPALTLGRLIARTQGAATTRARGESR